MRKVLYYIFLAIIAVIITTVILTTNGKSLFGYRIYRVSTGSMLPTLKINDIVIIKEADNYKINDIVTYESEQHEYITHRIKDFKDGKIIIKGDSNNIDDDPITENQIIGRVLFKITGLDFVFYLLDKPIIWALILVIGVLLILYIDLGPKENKEQKEEELL